MQTVAELRAIINEKVNGLVVPCHDEMGHHYRYLVTGEVYDSVTTKTGIIDAPHLKKWAAKMGVEYLLERKHLVVDSDIETMEELKSAAILAHQDYFEDAGLVGTAGHGVIEKYLTEWLQSNERPPDIRKFIDGVDHRLWAIARSAEQFMTDFSAEPVATELLVASGKYKIAGTLDALMFLYLPKKAGRKDCVSHMYLCTSNSKQTYQCYHCKQESVRQLCLVDWKTSNSADKFEYSMQVSAYWYALSDMTKISPKRIIIVRLEKKKAKYEVVEVKKPAQAFAAYKQVAKVYDWMKTPNAKPQPLNNKITITI